MTYWIQFPETWRLQDLQAYLNVLISFLCAGGIFILVRTYWKAAARNIVRGEDVLAQSILSLNTIGEVIDAMFLLRRDLLIVKRYRGLLVQSVFVILLTIASLFSGFIARYFTDTGTTEVSRNLTGAQAYRGTGSVLNKQFEINRTMSELSQANFPLDQLADFRPTESSPWKYQPSQWANSWAMDCHFLPLTPVYNIQATGNCTNKMWTEVPAMNQLWTNMPSFNRNWSYGYDRTGWRSNRTAYRDIFVFMHGINVNLGDYDTAINSSKSLSIRTILLHLQNALYNTSLPSGCTFSTGPIQSASYVDFYCNGTRNSSLVNNASLGASPDAYDVLTISSAYSAQYAGQFSVDSAAGRDTKLPSPHELLRFYQSYLIVKDTSTWVEAWKLLNVEIQVAQISVVCVILCSITAVIVLTGLVFHVRFLILNWSMLDEMPQSKLDWMIRSTISSDGKTNMHVLRSRFQQAKLGSTSRTDQTPLTSLTPLTDMQSPGNISASSFSTYATKPSPTISATYHSSMVSPPPLFSPFQSPVPHADDPMIAASYPTRL